MKRVKNIIVLSWERYSVLFWFSLFFLTLVDPASFSPNLCTDGSLETLQGLYKSMSIYGPLCWNNLCRKNVLTHHVLKQGENEVQKIATWGCENNWAKDTQKASLSHGLVFEKWLWCQRYWLRVFPKPMCILLTWAQQTWIAEFGNRKGFFPSCWDEHNPALFTLHLKLIQSWSAEKSAQHSRFTFVSSKVRSCLGDFRIIIVSFHINGRKTNFALCYLQCPPALEC